jgi:prepilin-type processing-associated H-X9-DG protein
MEMMTIIGIITLLLSISLPNLGQSKEVARKTKCASNLRQQGIAMQSYITNSGHYPGHAAASEAGHVMAVWPTRLRVYGPDRAMFDCPSAPIGFQWQTMISGAGGLFATQNDSRNWSYTVGERLLLTSGPSSIPFSYGYNDWGACNILTKPQRGLGGDLNFGFKVNELKDHQVKNPSGMIAIGDNVNDGAWDYNIDPTNPTEYPGKLHLKGCNMLFADTHVDWGLQTMWINVGTGNEEQRRVTSMWNNHSRPTPDQGP